jgi:hypothetical protein
MRGLMMNLIDISSIRADLTDILKKYTDYKQLSADKSNAYKYTALFNIRACPYCNINYVYTVEGAVRPDIDHFIAQTSTGGGVVALDPDNLVPACIQCNMRVKNRLPFTRSTHIHPLFDDFDSIKRFGVIFGTSSSLTEDSITIIFMDESFADPGDVQRADTNIKDLKLEGRYEAHRIDALKILRKIEFYNQSRLQEIAILTNTKDDLEDHLFEDKCCAINQHPLGKLKRDIIRQYK